MQRADFNRLADVVGTLTLVALSFAAGAGSVLAWIFWRV